MIVAHMKLLNALSAVVDLENKEPANGYLSPSESAPLPLQFSRAFSLWIIHRTVCGELVPEYRKLCDSLKERLLLLVLCEVPELSHPIQVCDCLVLTLLKCQELLCCR